MRRRQAEADTPILVKPRLVIYDNVWKRIQAYVRSCEIEIQGFGTVSVEADGTIVVDDVFILDQYATAASVEADQLALSRHTFEMMQRGDDPGRIKFQWHSHVAMQAYFSSTDTANIESWPGDWLISLVTNIRGQFACRMDIFTPLRVGFELQPQLVSAIDDTVMDEARAEVAARVMRRAGFFSRTKAVEPVFGSTTSVLGADEVDLDPNWGLESHGS